MTIEKIEGPYGWQSAIEGARKSFDSEGKSDTWFPVDYKDLCVGEKDQNLLSRLVMQGDSHAKCMRMVNVYLRIKAPRYWWQQFDTYRMGVEKQSASTMHTLMKRELTPDDFVSGTPTNPTNKWIEMLNDLIQQKRFDELKACLPEGFLQERVVMINYQALRHVYWDRKNHKLTEWQEFCDWVKCLPYANRLITPDL